MKYSNFLQCIDIYMCMYVFVCMYIYIIYTFKMCVCIYVYSHIVVIGKNDHISVQILELLIF